MICPKCGNKCSDNTVFCNVCGTKLNKVNDTSMEENSINNSGMENIIGGMSSDEVKNEKASKQKGTEKIIGDTKMPDKGLYESVQKKPEKKVEHNINKNDKNISGKKPKNNGTYVSTGSQVKGYKSKASKKKKILVIIIAILAVAAAIVTTYEVKKSTMTKKYNQFYAQGKAYYDSENYQYAKTQFITAANNAFTKEQKIQVYEMIYKVDEIIGGYDEEEIKYVELLVDLDKSNVTYYKNLIILYQNNDLNGKIESLINSAPSSIQDELKNFDGTIPAANIEGGTYNKPIKVELTATKNVKIYYTLDGSSVSNSPNKKTYKSPIKFEDEGRYKVRAMSIDSNGKKSKEMSVEYVLDFTTVSAPIVDLDSGKYSEQKEVTVTCDEGCEIYYTKDGTTPTTKDKKYTKPIKLSKGDSLYYFIAVDSNGVYSDVVTRAYDYSPEYNVSYSQALDQLTSKLVSDGTLENSYGEFKNGGRAYLNYNALAEIDGKFYYIVTCNIEKKSGSTKSSKTYAISCDSGEISNASGSGDSYSLSNSYSSSDNSNE